MILLNHDFDVEASKDIRGGTHPCQVAKNLPCSRMSA